MEVEIRADIGLDAAWIGAVPVLDLDPNRGVDDETEAAVSSEAGLPPLDDGVKVDEV